jgi:hypothetical protein
LLKRLTAVLITELIRGGKVTESANSHLSSSALIWLGNVLGFNLLYWLLDTDAPLARYDESVSTATSPSRGR